MNVLAEPVNYSGRLIGMIADKATSKIESFRDDVPAPALSDYSLAIAQQSFTVSVVARPRRDLEWLVYATLALDSNSDDIEKVAERISLSLLAIQRGAAELAALIRMAPRQLGKAEAAGVTCKFISASPLPMNADRDYVPMVDIRWQEIDASLRNSVQDLHFSRQADLAYQLRQLHKVQKARAIMKRWLSDRGATAAIDAVLFDALKLAGVKSSELAAALRQLRRGEIKIGGSDGTLFYLRWYDGCVIAREISLGGGMSWSHGNLIIRPTPRRLDKRHLGQLVADLLTFPNRYTRLREISKYSQCRLSMHCSVNMYPFILEDISPA